MLRLILVLQVLAVLCPGSIVAGPKNGVAASFWGGRDRFILLLDPAPAGPPSVTTFRCGGQEITAPAPLTKSGVYDYPSFKLVYELAGFSALDLMGCRFNASDFKYILREVWTPPAADGTLRPAGAGSAVFPHGFALYDHGKLITYLRAEKIWRRYTDPECFVLMIPSPPRYQYQFDESAHLLHLETAARGPSLFFGYPKWYHEEYTIDLSTGEILKVRIVDWIDRTLWLTGGLILCGGAGLVIRKRRRLWAVSAA